MSFGYDANGRMVKAARENQPDALSVYDSLGNRVATKTNDVWQFVIYDAFGKLVAEYGGLQASDEGGVKYVLSDWQGSVRSVLNNAGFVQSRSDYTSFGEEINSGVGLRMQAQGFGVANNTRQGYGLTEKDDSTGLNHTWFRKNENRAGRWTSPDPYNGSMNLGNPQSFNRYSYVENEPTNFVDPSGLIPWSGWSNLNNWGGINIGTFVVNVQISWFDWYWDSYFGAENGSGYSWTPTMVDVLLGSSGEENSSDDNDCQKFADKIEEIANRHSNAGAFLDELAQTFIGVGSSGTLEMAETRGVGNPLVTLTSSGFKAGFYDDIKDNQARHFIGGVIAGYNLGKKVGHFVMGFNEDSKPDLRLNTLSIFAGSRLTNEGVRIEKYWVRGVGWKERRISNGRGFRWLADFVRNYVCE